MIIFSLFGTVMAVAALALLVNHLSGLRSRVEIGGSELRVQQRRLAHIEDELLSADESQRIEIEHELASLRSRVETCSLLHATAMKAYAKTTATIPGSLVARWFPLSEAAKEPVIIGPLTIDLTESEGKGLTFSPPVVQLP